MRFERQNDKANTWRLHEGMGNPISKWKIGSLRTCFRAGILWQNLDREQCIKTQRAALGERV